MKNAMEITSLMRKRHQCDMKRFSAQTRLKALEDKNGIRYEILQLEPDQAYSWIRYKEEVQLEKMALIKAEKEINDIDDLLENLQKERSEFGGGFSF